MHVSISVGALNPNLGGIGRCCWELVDGIALDQRVEGLSTFLGSQWFTEPAGLLDGTAVFASASKR